MRPAAAGKETARKLAVSFEATLARDVQRAAEIEAEGNVSAWLAEAARMALRQSAARELLEDWEAKNGPITDQELAEVDRLWPAD